MKAFEQWSNVMFMLRNDRFDCQAVIDFGKPSIAGADEAKILLRILTSQADSVEDAYSTGVLGEDAHWELPFRVGGMQGVAYFPYCENPDFTDWKVPYYLGIRADRTKEDE